MADFRPVNLAEIYGAADAANMRRMQMDNYQRSIEKQQQEEARQQALRGAYAIGQDGRLDAEKTLSNLYGIDPVAAMEFRGKQDEAAMNRQKLAGEQEKQKFERIKNLTSVYKDTSTAIFANPTPQNAALQLQRFNKLTGEDVSQELQQIGSMTPEQIKQWAAGHALEADKVLTKFETKDTGGKLVTQGIDPLTGKVTITGQMDKTATPDAIMTDQRTRQENALNRGVTMRGQNLTDARAREKNQIDSANNGYSTKPLPATSLKMQNEALDKLSIASNNNAKLGQVLNQIENGSLKLGPVANVEGAIRNFTGNSNESSRNLSSFKSTLEKLRNDSLRLNTGVQTDGDAQRAWNELFENINDQELVKQRLQEIQQINQRGAELQKLQVENIRANYNAPPVDFSKYEVAPSEASQPKTPAAPKPGTVVDGYIFNGGNPADPKSWKKK